jgi:hypothetical protein
VFFGGKLSCYFGGKHEYLDLTGCHDNGYSTTLTRLENEGFLDKIVLLPGYNTLASELKRLDLPTLEIEVFMTKKITLKKSPLATQPKEFEMSEIPSPRVQATRSLTPAKASLEKVIDPSVVSKTSTVRSCSRSV